MGRRSIPPSVEQITRGSFRKALAVVKSQAVLEPDFHFSGRLTLYLPLVLRSCFPSCLSLIAQFLSPDTINRQTTQTIAPLHLFREMKRYA